MVDARLPDGSRVNVVSTAGAQGSVYLDPQVARTAMSVADLVRMGTLTTEMGDLLRLCVQGKLNVVVSGGTSTGKTTVLNILSSFIPGATASSRWKALPSCSCSRSMVRLESRPPNAEGKGQVAIRQLVINACACVPTVSSSAKCAAARRSTCCRQ